jgi:hypothetical protein
MFPDCEAFVRKIAALLFASLLFSLAPLAHADLAAIHVDKLPQEAAVLAAFEDAQQLEPYSHSWTSPWKYPIAKKEVAKRLSKDMDILTQALRNHPNNAELMLLAGLIERYAYNLDVPKIGGVAIITLELAQKLVPSDFRASWFLATFLCQTNRIKEGTDEFLSLENGHAWERLPVAFWDDYMECAYAVNMPAHLLRALDHTEKLHAPSMEMRNLIAAATRKRYIAFDPKKEYKPQEVWEGTNSGGSIEFTSTTCGVRLRARSDWGIDRLEFTNGSCLALFRTGPYKGTVNSRTPNVMLLVQQPKENETLQEYFAKFTKEGSLEPYVPAHCPADSCIAMKYLQPGLYKEDGDGHGRIIAFERNQPGFPGLIFESPLGPPASKSEQDVMIHHSGQIQQRIPGKLYYLVLLDTAASIEEPAMKDLDFFLENLTVE